MKYIVQAVLVSGSMVLTGCSETGVEITTSAPAASEFVNTVCPIMGNQIEPKEVEASLVKDFNGKKVAFCCPPCLEEWDELTDAEKSEKLTNPPKGDVHSH
ncbi:MAG: hypothetical protein U0936_01015 [Planctomycetaceae bacterium]